MIVLPISFEWIHEGSRPVAALAISPGGHHLAVGCGASVVVTKLPDCRPDQSFDAINPVRDVAFSPDGNWLAVACDEVVRVFQVSAGAAGAAWEWVSNGDGFHTVAWSPDGSLVAAGHYEPMVSLFNASRGELAASLDPNVFDDEGRTRVCFSPDGAVLASTAYNGVVFWNQLAAGVAARKFHKKIVRVRGHAHMIDAGYMSDGTLLATLAENEGSCTLHVWDVDSYRKVSSVSLQNYSIRLAPVPGSKFIAVAETDGNGLSLWDAISGERARMEFGGVAGFDVQALATDCPSSLVVAGMKSGEILGWRMAGN